MAINTATVMLDRNRYAGGEPLCLDCAAAVGERRYGLRKALRGKLCWSCIVWQADADYEAQQRAEEEKHLDAPAARVGPAL